MPNLHYNHESDEIRAAIEGKHDLATTANVDKLIALDLACKLPNAVADAVQATLENGVNCVGDADWQKVIDTQARPAVTVKLAGKVAKNILRLINSGVDPRTLNIEASIEGELNHFAPYQYKLRPGAYCDMVDQRTQGSLVAWIRSNAVAA